MKLLVDRLSDTALLAEVKRLALSEREATATLVAHLAVMDERELFLAEGFPSMFAYCTQVLHLSEDATYLRLLAARLVRRFPAVLDRLASGALNLSTIKLLGSQLTAQNCDALLDAASHRSKREVEAAIRRRDPLPDVPAVVRKLPTVGGSDATVPNPVAEAPALRPSETAETQRPSVVAPLAPERFKVQFTASAPMHDKLCRAQDLLRHQIPSGDIAKVFDLALTALVEKLERKKLAATDRPRESRGTASGSRTIPAAVKRAVWKRDGAQCAFIAKNGRRCSATGFLEFHHVMAFTSGGEATIENIALRCRAHNQYEAGRDFGPRDWGQLLEADDEWEARGPRCVGAAARSRRRVGVGGDQDGASMSRRNVAALGASPSISTTARANSSAVPGPRLVSTRPSRTTRSVR